MTDRRSPAVSRRAVLRGGGAALLLPWAVKAGAVTADSWAPARAILARIRPPRFPARDFDIRHYGADPASQARTSDALRQAIEACVAAGGGRVLVPAGIWPTGPIRLRSNVDLHVAQGATLRFSTNPDDYLPLVPTRFEGVECMNYSPLIYAYDEQNVAITGEGTLDGQASHANWWKWVEHAEPAVAAQRSAASQRLKDLAERQVPVAERRFGDGGFMRPSFVQPYRCTNVLIEGVRIVGSPMWIIHPVLSTNVTVRSLDIDSLGPNNDGCDPESCRDVLIERCSFATGDDCIAIKSGKNTDGRRVAMPSENIIVRDCHMKEGHGGVTLGSEASGGIRNIYVRDCRMGGPRLIRALRIKSNSYRGGYIENVVFRDVTIDQVAEGVLEASLLYGEGVNGHFQPRRIGGVVMEHVRSGASLYALDVQGTDALTIDGIVLRHCVFDKAAKGNRLIHAQVDARDVTVNGQPWRETAA